MRDILQEAKGWLMYHHYGGLEQAIVQSPQVASKKSEEEATVLMEGERAFGAWHYNATAAHYHGVNNAPGALEGVGPDLGNDKRLIERHLQRLMKGSPLRVVVDSLLESFA